MVFKKVTLRYKSSLKTWQLTQWPLSTISQALFLIWMNILETYDGHNISQVMKGDEYYPFIHEFRHFSLFRYVTNSIFSREQGPCTFFGLRKIIVSPVHTIGLNFFTLW